MVCVIVGLQSLNSDFYGSVKGVLLRSEREFMRAVMNPDVFFHLTNSLLLLVAGNLSSYRLMREQAAYANHDLFFAKNKNRSYDPKFISGYFSLQNLKDRHQAIEKEFRRHSRLHPALRDQELTVVYMRYVEKESVRDP